MLLAAAMILFGFVVLIWSADLFVAGAASIAKNLGMSPIIIGLTIVSIGTSAPEILVSTTASLSGAGDLAIGNAIGSNIANIALVLGLTVLVAPLMVEQRCLKIEMPILLLATFGVFALISDGKLTSFDGWLMISVLLVLVALLVRLRVGDAELSEEAAATDSMPHLTKGRAWVTFFFGLVLLVASSKALVWGAVFAAEELGVSKLVIGLTVVAIGTSLPELAASITSALRGHTEIALGNIIGSNLFNLLAVMAIPGVVATQTLEPAAISRDYFMMTLLTVFLALALFVSRRGSKASAGHAYLGRIVGTMLVSFYVLYYCLLYSTT
ncbi:MAG: calcium/sodium antiporter [Halioglobus sp.]|nr:calcium/sodium antiporter [Halioglobus sp.]